MQRWCIKGILSFYYKFSLFVQTLIKYSFHLNQSTSNSYFTSKNLIILVLILLESLNSNHGVK